MSIKWVKKNEWYKCRTETEHMPRSENAVLTQKKPQGGFCFAFFCSCAFYFGEYVAIYLFP